MLNFGAAEAILSGRGAYAAVRNLGVRRARSTIERSRLSRRSFRSPCSRCVGETSRRSTSLVASSLRLVGFAVEDPRKR
jgi:hypothetical protein